MKHKFLIFNVALLLSAGFALSAAPRRKAAAKKAPVTETTIAVEQKIAATPADDAKAKEAEMAKKYGISEELLESIRRKREPSETDLAKKKEGGYFTGLPLINSDPNTGVGYGVRLFYFNTGEKENPLFRRTPYRTQVYAQFFQTTLGYQYHELNWDAPYVLNSLFRLRTNFVFEKNTWANFFGNGSRSMNALTSPSGTQYDKYADFNTDLRKISGGTTNAAYHHYSYEKPTFNVMLERDMFGGIVRPQIGLQISKYSIWDLAGTKVKADGGDAINNNTLLTQYQNAGLLVGRNGGWYNTARVGVAIDTRDYEPDPNSGQLFEAVAEVSNQALGAATNFARYTLSERVFYSPFPKLADLVIAGRGVYAQSVGDVPFYAMNQFSSTERVYLGALGGLRSLRGYKDNRFVANNIAIANLELRWTTFDFRVLGQNFAPILVPFFDIGSAFDQPKDISKSQWRYAYGMGLRIAWNQATIIMVDYAMSKEDSNLFINFNHIF
ncbi:MAG TPA: DUF5982 domain-containing protein [Turneriella sp.]|nr:DUF5982 domain-containing protein [Turneriella sp.]